MDKTNNQPAEIILHITRQSDWETAVSTGYYRPESFDEEGFIHCSTPQQLLLPANSLFYGQKDLLLLVVNPARLQARVVYEDCYQSGQVFPHLYGSLNLDAVIEVISFPPNPDGTFSLPTAIQQLGL